jgi:hypothetical protein
MKRIWLQALAALVLLGGRMSYAADEKDAKADRAKSEKRTVEKPVAQEGAAEKAESKPRLPAGFGQLGLTDDQDKAIRGVLRRYATQMRSLQQQLKLLRDTRDAELQVLLTPEQKQQLAEARNGKSKEEITSDTDQSAASQVPRKAKQERRARATKKEASGAKAAPQKKDAGAADKKAAEKKAEAGAEK